ncbi:MAG: hypothetical protein H0T71_03235 [Acidobacteria bacterium]|nr:hypothetical protein [Acidobacteriota bacterium]
MEWSWAAWLGSVAAVVISGLAAWLEDSWAPRPGLEMGFVNHGGMWGDLLLLPLANAVIVPHLTVGPWMAGALVVSSFASVWVHIYWYRGYKAAPSPDHSVAPGAEAPDDGEMVQEYAVRRGRGGEHMWPARPHGSWRRDLSWAGWAHVVYVIGELGLLIGFLLHAMPIDVVLVVTAVFTVHIAIGLLQPRYFLSGHLATATEQPLLLPLLLGLWAVSLVKIVGLDRLAG